MSSDSTSTKPFNQCKNIPVNYLFAADYDNSGNILGKYRPIPGVILFTETMVFSETGNTCSKPVTKLRPWFTNYNGVLNHLNNDFSEGTRWYALSEVEGNAQDVFFPTVEQISFFYAALGNKWVQIISDGLLNELKEKQKKDKNSPNINSTIQLKQMTILFDELLKPKTDEELRKELSMEQGVLDTIINNEYEKKDNKESIIIDENHPDIIYRSWYKKQKQINETLHGFVIPQSRYIVFTFSHPDSVYWFVSFWQHGTKELEQKLTVFSDKKKDSNIFTAIYRAPVHKLLKGLYTIKITPVDIENNWLEQCGETFYSQQSYQLTENFRFGLKNIAGEFEIINCDPITVEESLLKQFPLSYSHLIKDSYLKMQGESLSAKSLANNSGLKTVVSELQLRKQQADQVQGFFTADNGLKQTNIVAKGISAALLNSGVNIKIRSFVNTAFQVNDFGYKIFQNIPDKLKDIKEKTNFAHTDIDKIISKLEHNNFLHWRYKNLPDSSDALKNAWGGRLASNKYIPTEFINKTLGAYSKVAKPIDGALLVFNLINTGTQLYDAGGNVEKALYNARALFLDYHQQLHEWEDELVIAHTSAPENLPASTFRPDEQGQICFSLFFDTNKSLIKPETGQYNEDKAVTQNLSQDQINDEHYSLQIKNDQAILELVKFLNKNDTLKILIVGHTDPVGRNSDNKRLSEQRATAVKQLLIEQGIAADRLMIKGLGESRLVMIDGEVNYEKSRRVEIVSLFFGHAKYTPSREAMAFLEQSRDVSVLQELEVDKAQLALAADGWSAIKFTLAALPSGITQIAALVITIAEAGIDVIKNVGAWADSVLLDKLFQTIIAQQKKLSIYQGASLANQRLLRESIHHYKKNPASFYLNTQHRVRAEALYGLIGLITRASISTRSQSEFVKKIKAYQIDAYIDNFLLNDGWRFPLEPDFPITMDEFWLFVIRTKAHHTGVNYNWYGFDIHFKLLKEPQEDSWGMPDSLAMQFHHANDFYQRSQAIISPGELTADIIVNQNAGETGKYGQHLYSLAGNDVPEHQKADFQSCFPIHHLHSKEISKLAMDFNTDFSDIDDDTYQYTAIYARPPEALWQGTEPDWLILEDYQKTKKGGVLSPFDQIRILVVFHTCKDTTDTRKNTVDINGIYPAAIQLHRRDMNNIDGPRYRTLARRLDKGELLKKEQKYVDHVGYVVYPFYHFGQTTYSGTKPLATKLSLSLAQWRPTWDLLEKGKDSKGFEQAYDYWRMGGLDDMYYEFTANIGDEKEGHPIRISGKDSDWLYEKEYKVSIQGRELVSKTKTRGIGRSVYYKKTYHWLPDARLLYAPFLMSGAKEATRPELFTEDEDIKVLIRIGGAGGSDYLCSHSKFYSLIGKSNNQKYGIHLHSPNVLTFDQFDWNTPVEFIFLVTSDEIDSDGYEVQNYKWDSIPYSVKMKEFTGSDTNGPVLSGKLSYLGILNNNRVKGKARFEIDNQKETIPLELQPLIDVLSKRDDCSHALSGFNEGGLFSDKRYVFAAHYKCQYESLTGQSINSIRPFSRHDSRLNSERVELDGDESENDYFRFGLTDFIAGGQNISSGLVTIKNSDEFVGKDIEFRFRSPKNLMHAPWTALPVDSDQKITEAKKLDKETLLTNWVNKSEDEKKEAVKFWIEEDTSTIKQLATRVYR